MHFSAVCRSSDAKTKENSFHFAGKDIACKEIWCCIHRRPLLVFIKIWPTHPSWDKHKLHCAEWGSRKFKVNFFDAIVVTTKVSNNFEELGATHFWVKWILKSLTKPSKAMNCKFCAVSFCSFPMTFKRIMPVYYRRITKRTFSYFCN